MLGKQIDQEVAKEKERDFKKKNVNYKITMAHEGMVQNTCRQHDSEGARRQAALWTGSARSKELFYLYLPQRRQF